MSEGGKPDGEQEGHDKERAQQVGDDEAYFADLPLGKAWGESITKERAAELETSIRAWEQETDHGERKGPFDRGPGGIRPGTIGNALTGADVFWLAARTWAKSSEVQAVSERGERLRSSALRSPLRSPDLNFLNLAGASLDFANLTGAYLQGANLAGADLTLATLTRASLEEANLAEAYLVGAYLADAFLTGANLTGAYLLAANLAGASLISAKLASASMEKANLSGAHLNKATFDYRTNLTNVLVSDALRWYTFLVKRFSHEKSRRPVSVDFIHWDDADLLAQEMAAAIYNTSVKRSREGKARGPFNVADTHWNDVDLTVLDWSALRRLGDEQGKRWWWRSRGESENAVRANIQLAKRLRDAGMNDDADRFAYRAQVRQRGIHLMRWRPARWLFSWLLFVIAGYGYRPLRTLFWYLATIGCFAFAYYMATRGAITFGLHPSKFDPLAWYEALVLSVSSFHGRGFLPFPDLGDPVTILAALEAVFGLFIEVSFIATFTQRYFGK